MKDKKTEKIERKSVVNLDALVSLPTKDGTRWVVVGVHGLYTGQWLTRKDAIDAHVGALYLSTFIETHEQIMDMWQDCKKKGDKAVKAKITWAT